MQKMTVCVILVLVMLVFGTTGVFAQIDECAAKGGTWISEEAKCAITMQIDIDISYPILMTSSRFVEETVDAYLATAKSDFLSLMTDPYFMPIPGMDVPFAMGVDFEAFQFSERIVGINFTIYENTGGAHPNTYFKTFMFDLEHASEIGFLDVFLPDSDPLSLIAPIVEADVTAQLGEYADAAWIEQGSGTNPDNYQNFVVTSDELILFFPPYQVAAYAAGPQIVHIPLSQIGAILASPFAQ
jgi:hypothetical protein